jgi:membrane protease YdiL (CAAX protease family)
MFGYSPPDWISRSSLVESIAAVPALLEVSRATQRSVLAMLGEKCKPLIALEANLGLGIAAGVGEERLFRGIIQGGLVTQVGDNVALISSAVVFGALHAVTPLYVILAGVASLHFGQLNLSYGNLGVPIVCHASHLKPFTLPKKALNEIGHWWKKLAKAHECPCQELEQLSVLLLLLYR